MRPAGEITPGVRAGTGRASGPSGSDVALEAAGEVERQLAGQVCDLVVVFLGGAHAGAAADVVTAIGSVLEPRCLVGVTAGAVVEGDDEIESEATVVVWGARLPGATITPLRYGPPSEEAGAAGPEPALGWPAPPEGASALMVFADPFSFPSDGFLSWVQQGRPGLPVSGGLASGARRPGGNRLLLDGAVHEEGAVAVAIAGIEVRTLVSQGCRPVGPSFVVTKAERNLLQELAGAPPVDRIREVYAEADPRDQELMRAGLHIGTVIDEYADSHERGDFLVRGVLGAHPRTGAVAVGDMLRVGQTVRFHVRDAGSADEDLRALLPRIEGDGGSRAALLFTCNGRGSRLFGQPGHDARLVRRSLGGAPLAGFFCAGEFGPVGSRSYLHGFTASLLVFEGQAAVPGAEM